MLIFAYEKELFNLEPWMADVVSSHAGVQQLLVSAKEEEEVE